MAKNIVKALVGILFLLVPLTIYFILVGDSGKVFLCTRLTISVSAVFLYISFLFYALEKYGLDKPWRGSLLGACGILFVYPLFQMLDYVVSYSIRLEKTAGISTAADMNFYGWAFLVICFLGGLGALLYGLSPKTRPNRRRKDGGIA